ncbi:MAG: ABC transporter ATP-binding protein [Sarcina sp.]
MSKVKKGPMGGHGPMGGAMKGGEKAKDFKGTIKNLYDYLKPYRLKIFIVILFAIGSVTFTIVGPKILGKATTKVFEGLTGKVMGIGAGMDFDYIGRMLLILVGLYIFSTLLSFVQGFIMSGVTQKVSYNLREAICKKINKLPLRYFDGKNHGEVLSRVTNDVDAISQNLNQSITQLITAITTVIGVLIMMLSISVTMTIAAVLIVPISMFMIIFIVKKSQKYFKMQQEYLGHVNGEVEEIYSGHVIVKAFNGEEKAVNQFNQLNEELYNSAWKSQFLSGMMMPIMTFIGNLGYVMVSILGGWLAIRKSIEVGDILSFIQYVRNFSQPIAQTAQIANLMQSTAAAAERVFEFLDEEEEVDSKDLIEVKEIEGAVKFDSVNFGYNRDKIIINNFSIDIKAGQRIAIVGPTGAGKTTIVKLLMRFYDLNSGEILIDDTPINKLERNVLRNLFGMVLQDTWLFNGTIKDNISYGTEGKSEEEIIKAAKEAQVHHFVKTLPEGYNMMINEEANNISQGQKQLLTIARVILKDPKILILDEATSSVDTRTELLIQKAMDNLMKNRTSFIIAHRLSTIREADLIIVMDKGDIVETGSHKELLKLGGFYEKLYNSQFEEV